MLNVKTVIIALAFLMICSSKSFSGCGGGFPNPLTEIAWSNVFPLYIGGIKVYDTGNPDRNSLGSPICVCDATTGLLIGLTVSFWEPAGIIDTVIEPWCFPVIGSNLNVSIGERHKGDMKVSEAKEATIRYSGQTHWIKAPFLSLLNIFDQFSSCTESYFDFDVAYASEVDPLWQDDILAAVLTPEVVLFANPIAGLACIADAAKAAFDLPIDQLFWCMGSWGTVYPLTKNISVSSTPTGAIAEASKLLFRLHRNLIFKDKATNYCYGVRKPIWTKSHFRLQPLRPKPITGNAIRIGQPGSFWQYKTFDPRMEGGENWSFVLWRKVTCCIGFKLGF